MVDESIYRVIKMCDSCPFHSSDGQNIHLREGRLDEIKQDLEKGGNFICHKKLYIDEDSDRKMCAGAYEYLKALNKPNQIMQIFDRLNHKVKNQEGN